MRHISVYLKKAYFRILNTILNSDEADNMRDLKLEYTDYDGTIHRWSWKDRDTWLMEREHLPDEAIQRRN